MEASASTTKVRGWRRHRLHEKATAATFVAGPTTTSKRFDLVGHKPLAVRGGGRPKRPLEVRLYQDDYDSEDEDDYEVREATFVVDGPDGAYTSFEMPKRINLGYGVGETSAVLRRCEAEDERDVAVGVRLKSDWAAMMRDMRVAAAKAADPQRNT